MGKAPYPQSYDHAFFCFSEAICNAPVKHDILVWRGRSLMALGKFSEAVYDFTWAIQMLESDNSTMDRKKELQSEYHRYAGQAHFEMNFYQEARLHFQKAFESEPKNSKNLFNRGLVLSKLGDYRQANADFD